MVMTEIKKKKPWKKYSFNDLSLNLKHVTR